jgi:tetratricopeptide (TPR) repeat protein
MSKKSRRVKQSALTRQGSPMKQHAQRAAMPTQMYERMVQRVEYASEQLHEGNFAGCILTCEALLSSAPQHTEAYLEALALLGLAHGMSKHYQQSYEIFGKAIVLDPTRAEYWYNHGLACTYMSRLGEAVSDFEHAVKLVGKDTSEMARKFAAQLEESRQELQEAMEAYGEGTTLKQYMEGERQFTQAMDLMMQEKWQEAEQLFRHLTETTNRVVSYWGNLGVCLTMQSRYDEAEEALKRALTIDPDYAIARNNLRKLPEVRRANEPLGLKVLNTTRGEDVKQSLALYEKGENGEIIGRTIIEEDGSVATSRQRQGGLRPPQYDFFLNTYQDTRFTVCPRCNIKTRSRKFSLVVHVDHDYTIIVDKMCRFCYVCGLLVVHQDQLEQQLCNQFAQINPKAIGNAYQVAGTLDRAEWNKAKQEPLSFGQLIEYLHDFKAVVMFQRVPVEE